MLDWLFQQVVRHFMALMAWGLAFLAVMLLAQLPLRSWLHRRWRPRRWPAVGALVVAIALVLAPLVSFGCGVCWAAGRAVVDTVGEPPPRVHGPHPDHPHLGRIADTASDKLHQPIDRRRQSLVDDWRAITRRALAVQLVLIAAMGGLQALAARLRSPDAV